MFEIVLTRADRRLCSKRLRLELSLSLRRARSDYQKVAGWVLSAPTAGSNDFECLLELRQVQSVIWAEGSFSARTSGTVNLTSTAIFAMCLHMLPY